MGALLVGTKPIKENTMRHGLLFLFAVCGIISMMAEESILRYEDATHFRLINKGWVETSAPYQRLPKYMQDSCRENQWWLYTCSAGIGVRFRTNSANVGARYHLQRDFYMAHMAMTGIKGTDLYRLNEYTGKWQYVNTARPIKDSIQHKVYLNHTDTAWHEYMLYLPLYDGIDWLEIGVDSAAGLEYPRVDSPRKGKRIVIYGTSIQQGGCASRTGMVSSAMIQRDLNMEVVNLATSGEGKMDMYIARLMAGMEDVACFVLDPVPNCTQMMCDTLTYDFVNILRRAQPDVPIVMVETMIYPYAKFDSSLRDYLPAKNSEWHKNYNLLKADNPNNLYYMSFEGQTGRDEEGTVDGIHLTDLGFRAYADRLEAILQTILQ